MMSEALVDLVGLIHLLVVLSCSTTLVVTLWRYWEHVLYRTGVLGLVSTLLVFTVGAVVDVAIERGVGPPAFVLLDDFLFTAAAALAVVASWSFARDFIVTDLTDREPEHESEDAEAGGFENA